MVFAFATHAVICELLRAVACCCLGTALVCRTVPSSSTAVTVSVCDRLGRSAGCAARCTSSRAEALILLFVTWLDDFFLKNGMPGFFQAEGLLCRWSCSESREHMTTTASCTSDAHGLEFHPTYDFVCWRTIPCNNANSAFRACALSGQPDSDMQST